MMNHAAFLLIGIVFGVTMYKTEAISWYRIQEMFRFHSFHMYGIMGSAVLTAMLLMIRKYCPGERAVDAVRARVMPGGARAKAGRSAAPAI